VPAWVVPAWVVDEWRGRVCCVSDPGKTYWGQSKTRWTIAILLAVASAATGANALDPGADNSDAAGSETVNSAFDFTHVSCTGGENEIRIRIMGVKQSVGLLTADLYPNKQDGFLSGRGRLKQVKYAAKAPVTQFCIQAPEAGNFAIAVYHDRNANGVFDRTGLGLPNEPWGISNNPKVRFSAPPVGKALFDVTQDGAKLEINLK